MVEKEKLLYAPFSGVGGIVYDKDAVYVELRNNQSQIRREGDEASNIVANLIETKQSADLKMEHSELQIFTGGRKITAKDFDSMEYNDSLECKEKINIFKTKDDSNCVKQDLDLNDELSMLRLKKYKEKEVEDNGRIRRKVIFENACESIESDVETHSDDDSDQDIFEDKNENIIKSAPKPKDTDDIHLKIKEVLVELENKNTLLRQDLSSSDEDSDDCSESNSGRTKSSSKKNTNKINKKLCSDNCKSDSDIDVNHHTRDSNVILTDDALSGSDEENDEDTNVIWKENLVKKAQNAFLERIGASQNLMKMVYGMYCKFQNMLIPVK